MRSQSLKSKLIVAVALLASGAIVASAYALFAYYARATKRQLADSQLALATLLASDIDDKLTSAHAQLISLARDVDPASLARPDGAQAFLDRHLHMEAAFFTNGLFLFDRAGRIVAEAPQRDRRGRDFSYREYLATTLRTRRPYVGAPYRSTRTGSPPAIMLTAPVLDERGELVGVLGGAVNLLSDSVLGRTVHLRSGKSGYFFLFDRDRTMILHPDPTRILQRDIPTGSNLLLDRAIAGFDGTGETVNSRGLAAITSFKHLRATDWIVGANLPVTEAYAPITHAARALAAFVAVTVVALVLLAWRLMNALTRPLLALTAHLESISDKEGPARRVAVTTGDEIGQLGAAFNRMLTHLDAKQGEVERERERLAQAAHHWRATFDGIRDGVCVLDAQERVALANRAMGELVGTAPGELEGLPVRALLGRLLEGAPVPEVVAGAGRVPCRSGNRWFELQRDTIDLPAAGGTEYVQLVADVTRQQSLQEQLLQSQKMHAIGQLAGGVAHDFNNVLTVVMTLASSVRDELPAGELRELVREIERAGQRGATLTRRLLAFSRKEVLHPRTLDASAVVAEIAGMIERLIGDDIRLALRLEDAGAVRMDPAQLEQILVNLAVNARDAMPNGGTIAIRVDGIELPSPDCAASGQLAPGPYVRIRVEDTGCGIPADVLPHVFEPFFTTKARGKGTGLGLTTVYGAVQQGGGGVTIASEVGAGTTFSVYLPRAGAPPDCAAAAEDAALPRGRGQRVLVVDDEPMLRAALERLLRGGGYAVLAASSAEEAVEVFGARGDGIDLVVTDLVMPGMGGIALGRALRQRSAVPILYMSGYSAETASGRETLPEEQFIPKPFDRDAVLRRVARALRPAA